MTPGDIEDLLLQYEADVAVWTRTPDKYNYAEVLDGRKKIAALLEAIPALEPEPVQPDTGHPEADRVLGRLASSDPDFDDCTAAAALIRRLVCDAKGPDGFATWKDAAIAERMKRTAPPPPDVQRDAERYRWLRDGWWLDPRADVTPDPMMSAETPEQFDAAIDAARAAEAKEGGL